MAYTPDPTDPTQPTLAQPAGDMAYELQAIKGYIQSLIVAGNGFVYSGGMKNRLKNGAFRIQQRGAGPFTVNSTLQYTIDDWPVFSINGTTSVLPSTTSTSIPGLGVTTVGVFISTSNVTFLVLCPRAEAADCSDLIAGTPVTISGWYITNSFNALPVFSIQSPTLGNDNWSASIASVSAAVPFAFIAPLALNTWTHFSATAILTGDCTKGAQFNISFTNPGVQTFDFANMQVEKGSLATPFEQRPIGHDLALCQRMFQIGHYTASLEYSAAGSPSLTIPFATNMRVAPTMSVDFTGTQWGSPTFANLSGFGGGTGGFSIAGTTVSSGYYNVILNYTATAEL